jgi:hypothetical protein
MLRIPNCLDNRLIDGGNVVSPMHPAHMTSLIWILFLSGVFIFHFLRFSYEFGYCWGFHGAETRWTWEATVESTRKSRTRWSPYGSVLYLGHEGVICQSVGLLSLSVSRQRCQSGVCQNLFCEWRILYSKLWSWSGYCQQCYILTS